MHQSAPREGRRFLVHKTPRRNLVGAPWFRWSSTCMNTRRFLFPFLLRVADAILCRQSGRQELEMRVAVAFDHAVRKAALAACLSSDDTSITALADRSQRWPRGREQMRRRGVATVAATAGSSQPIKAQSLVSVLIYQSETRSPTR